MELRTLRYFVEIAEAGTVSAAADIVHVTQPGLSRQLRQLERELGMQLFDRVGGRLLLSPAGRDLLPRARDVLTRADHLAVLTADVGARAAGAADARRTGDHARRRRVAVHRHPRAG